MIFSNFDRAIQIQARDGTQNPDGSLSNNWTTLYNCRASIVEGENNEMIHARAMFSELGAIFTIRWRASQSDPHCGVNAQMRVVYKNQVYEILGVTNVGGRHEQIKLYCRKYGDRTTPYN